MDKYKWEGGPKDRKKNMSCFQWLEMGFTLGVSKGGLVAKKKVTSDVFWGSIVQYNTSDVRNEATTLTAHPTPSKYTTENKNATPAPQKNNWKGGHTNTVGSSLFAPAKYLLWA